MEIKKGLKLAKEIFENTPYETQKKRITELFRKTENSNSKDIILRLIVIDSCYSTNMNKRLFAFEAMSNLILRLNEKIDSMGNVYKFIKNNFTIMTTVIGINKKGNDKGHGLSLLTKYLYFRMNLNFPIYDSLVYNELIQQKFLDGSKQPKPTIEYFEKLQELKDKHNLSFDELDCYFWVCGKIRKGSLSLLIDDQKLYKEMIEELKLPSKNKKIKSSHFDELIKKEIKNRDAPFKDKKLNNIRTLLLELES